QVDLAANTERWVKNEFITDSYDLAVPSGALGKVEIGLYDEASGKRLPLCQAGTCGQADSLLLESACACGRCYHLPRLTGASRPTADRREAQQSPEVPVSTALEGLRVVEFANYVAGP